MSQMAHRLSRMEQELTEAQALARLRADGANELPQSKPRSLMRLLREVVCEPMFLLLVACGAIYMLLGDMQEALMLLGFVFVVIAITFVQQRRTERSLQALREMFSPQALVRREGHVHKMDARELVVGDTVLLAEGDRVPADLRLVEASNLWADESMLTGESVPVGKQAAGAESSTVFSGTLITQGKALGIVIATGVRSALGRIGQSLSGMEEQRSAIQQETRRVVKWVALLGLALAALLALAWWLLLGDWLHGVLSGLTLAMAVLPEELPLVLTLFMGLGAWRLAREKVLVRNIAAVEVLGATTVLCVDKTGTLTQNRMVVQAIWGTSRQYDAVANTRSELHEDLHGVLEYAVLACHRQTFDPMEAAIVDAGQTLLANTEHLHANWTLVDDYALSPEMLAMSRVWQSPDLRQRMIAAKGAPEAIVDLCHLDADRSARIADQVLLLAAAGLRVLGVANASFSASALPSNQHDFDFEFLGLIALQDPMRPTVPAAIAQCKAAGIRVVMMTGDHPATALAIARQAGLDDSSRATTGAELATLSDTELATRLASTQVYCRVQPEQKLRLVQAYQASGAVVAMTGDGVNDAPALKVANVGVAMGARGTAVARQAADIVLLDDDFSSIVTAMRYGRRVFANLRKAIVFVVAVHVPIVGLSLLPVLLGWPMVLMPVHILFLQLIIDPACSMVFEAQALEHSAMQRPPRRVDAHLFDKAVLLRGLLQGAGLLVLLLASYGGAVAWTGSHALARGLTFMVLLLSALALILVNSSWDKTNWSLAAPENRYFVWLAGAAMLLLGLVLGVPAINQLFAFAVPPPPLLLAGAAVSVAASLWFDLTKRWTSG